MPRVRKAKSCLSRSLRSATSPARRAAMSEGGESSPPSAGWSAAAAAAAAAPGRRASYASDSTLMASRPAGVSLEVTQLTSTPRVPSGMPCARAFCGDRVARTSEYVARNLVRIRAWTRAPPLTSFQYFRLPPAPSFPPPRLSPPSCLRFPPRSDIFCALFTCARRSVGEQQTTLRAAADKKKRVASPPREHNRAPIIFKLA
jgi:hypothetical protein